MEQKTRHTFRKSERLKSSKEIDRLFQEGRAFNQYPIRWVWVPAAEEQEYPLRVGVSVSKRKFKHAVDRNRIKRLMREAWRLNKGTLYRKLPEGEQFSLMLIYMAKEELSFREIEQKVKRGMARFAKYRHFTPQKGKR